MAVALDGVKVLIADDEQPIRELLRDILEPEGAQIRMARSGMEALKLIDAEEPDVAVFDVRMPAPDGLALLVQLRQKGLDFPVLIITAQDSSTVTIEAMQRGAYDYLAKPFDPDEVLAVVGRAAEHRRLTRRVNALEQQVSRDPRDIIIGRSAPMQQVYKTIGRVAATDSTVLITGESGTGKELVAQVLHRSSPRREGPFVAVNCAALPETLLESELFGHEKGAFTGAMATRKGLFEQANKGTLFLDEIGEITSSTQKKLLRVLQERTVVRVGANTPFRVDVRIISATNRDLLHDAESGHFREDLYYRLNVINLHMPPLRDRKDDIALLVTHFLGKHALRDRPAPTVTEQALVQLLEFEWPGNVRQLEHAIERAVVMAQGGPISPEHLQLNVASPATEQRLTEALTGLLNQGVPLDALLADVRTRLVALALSRSSGDRAAAAQTLGVAEADLG